MEKHYDAFLLEPSIRQECSIITIIILMLGILGNSIRKKENNGTKIIKEMVKLSLFADNMVVQLKKI